MFITRYSLPQPGLQLKISVIADHDRPIEKAIKAEKTEKSDLIVLLGDFVTGHITKEAWDADNREWADELGILHEKRPWKEPKNAVRIL